MFKPNKRFSVQVRLPKRNRRKAGSFTTVGQVIVEDCMEISRTQRKRVQAFKSQYSVKVHVKDSRLLGFTLNGSITRNEGDAPTCVSLKSRTSQELCHQWHKLDSWLTPFSKNTKISAAEFCGICHICPRREKEKDVIVDLQEI